MTPAGAVIWILANIDWNGSNLAQHAANFLHPLGYAVGLDGVILLAYVVAIPANEIVVPTMLMVYMGVGMMSDLTSYEQIRTLLVDQHGWTLLTAVNLMLFSVLHNPCATTILTIWRETRSRRWTIIGALMPLAFAFLATFVAKGFSRISRADLLKPRERKKAARASSDRRTHCTNGSPILRKHSSNDSDRRVATPRRA